MRPLLLLTRFLRLLPLLTPLVLTSPIRAAESGAVGAAAPTQADQSIAAAEAQRRARQEKPVPKRGALFKITKDGHELYLFGTIHVGLENFYPLEPVVRDAIGRAPTMALEIDPLNAQAAQQAIRDFGLYPRGRTNRLDIPLELQQRIEALARKHGVSYDALAQMKPWMVATTLATFALTGEQYRAAFGVDAYLARIARSQDKPIIGLETPSSQFALFDRQTTADQLRYLRQIIDEVEDNVARVKALQVIELWRNADAAGMEALAKTLDEDTSATGTFFKKVLLDGRHPYLADKIASLLEKQPTSFVAIGVLHLIGDNSVPALLQQRGYQVERVY